MAYDNEIKIVTISGIEISNNGTPILIRKSEKEISESIKEMLWKYVYLTRYFQIPKNVSVFYTSGSNEAIVELNDKDVELFFVDYESLGEREGNEFFHKYGVGNAVLGIDSPFERAEAYELLLKILQEYDSAQFLKIHKGTPYYFIGWTAFQFLDYERSLYYMDAAISEDLRFPDVMSHSNVTPALDFFLLNDNSVASGLGIHKKLIDIVTKELREFSSRSSINVTKSDIVNRFVEPLLYSDVKRRSVLTSLYSFLLKCEKRKTEIRLRSATGGSIQPFLDHLFDGAVLLESILGIRGRGDTLRSKISSLSQLTIDATVLLGGKTLAEAESTFTSMKIAGKNFQDCAFAASYIIRNTTGHSLVWPDQFVNENSYTILYNSLVDSIFWSIYKLWIE